MSARWDLLVEASRATLHQLQTDSDLDDRVTNPHIYDRLEGMLRDALRACESGVEGGYIPEIHYESEVCCDECGNTIPCVNGGGLANRHHKDSCSLYEPGAS